MQLSRRSILLLLLFSWLSVLASARAILSACQDCSEEHCPVQLQRPSLVEVGELEWFSNATQSSSKVGELSIASSTFKHEAVVKIKKRKSPSSSGSSGPDTNSGDPGSTSSSDDGNDTSTGGGLDLGNPTDNDPSTTPQDPGAGLDPFATAPSSDPSPATVDPTVATPDPTTAGSAAATSLTASASNAIPTGTVASQPAVAPTDTSSSSGPQLITDEEAAARFCPSSPGDLQRRGLCGSRVDGDDGSDSEPPASVIQDPDPLPPGVGPAVDRTTVNDWYDVVQQDPKPLFRAREALDARIAGKGQDKPVADFTGKYFPFEDDPDKDIFTPTNMKSISTMWTTLGRTTPGKAQKIFITPESDQELPIHEAIFAEDGSLIGALESYRDKDPLKDSPDRIEWSELMFKQLNEISGGNVGNLKAVARSSIVTGKATDSTIRTALTRTGKTTTKADEVVTFRADAPAGSEEALAFEAISRSDNVNGVLFLLADHFDAFGGKGVTGINVAQTTDGQAFNMIIDIA